MKCVKFRRLNYPHVPSLSLSLDLNKGCNFLNFAKVANFNPPAFVGSNYLSLGGHS